jgi:hypothetical protein
MLWSGLPWPVGGAAHDPIVLPALPDWLPYGLVLALITMVTSDDRAAIWRRKSFNALDMGQYDTVTR